MLCQGGLPWTKKKLNQVIIFITFPYFTFRSALARPGGVLPAGHPSKAPLVLFASWAASMGRVYLRHVRVARLSTASLRSHAQRVSSCHHVQVEAETVHCCAACRAHLADHDAIISKAFQGRHGRAYLFADVINVSPGPKENRLLLTGLHVVADIYCNACDTRVGWKYVEAFEESQKYKEGKFILEKAMILKEDEIRERRAEQLARLWARQAQQRQAQGGGGNEEANAAAAMDRGRHGEDDADAYDDPEDDDDDDDDDDEHDDEHDNQQPLDVGFDAEQARRVLAADGGSRGYGE